jgi:hypothetical protein
MSTLYETRRRAHGERFGSPHSERSNNSIPRRAAHGARAALAHTRRRAQSARGHWELLPHPHPRFSRRNPAVSHCGNRLRLHANFSSYDEAENSSLNLIPQCARIALARISSPHSILSAARCKFPHQSECAHVAQIAMQTATAPRYSPRGRYNARCPWCFQHRGHSLDRHPGTGYAHAHCPTCAWRASMPACGQLTTMRS